MIPFCEQGRAWTVPYCIVCGDGPCKIAPDSVQVAAVCRSIPRAIHFVEIDTERDFDFAADVPNRLYGATINHEGEAI